MSNSGRIILITNRNVNPGRTDLSLFGDDLNTIHNADLNIASVTKKRNKGWELQLLSNPTNPNYEHPASKILFNEIAAEAADGKNKEWVFFIHGFNQSLSKNLKKCLELVNYGVNVVAFSWPSNPGPSGIFYKAKEYKKAQQNARLSVFGLSRTMEKLYDHMYRNTNGTHLNLNLVIHSLGNYLFQEYVKTSESLEYLKMFNNILLNEPDVDSKGHEQWIDLVTEYTKLYVTINEHDAVLNGSDVINKNRLGNTVRQLKAEEAVYMNFTDGLGVRKNHRPWNKPARKNTAIANFYSAVFRGEHGEKVKGWKYSSKNNAYSLIKKEPLLLDSDHGE